jgi:hypothetical protein
VSGKGLCDFGLRGDKRDGWKDVVAIDSALRQSKIQNLKY